MAQEGPLIVSAPGRPGRVVFSDCFDSIFYAGPVVDNRGSRVLALGVGSAAHSPAITNKEQVIRLFIFDLCLTRGSCGTLPMHAFRFEKPPRYVGCRHDPEIR